VRNDVCACGVAALWGAYVWEGEKLFPRKTCGCESSEVQTEREDEGKTSGSQNTSLSLCPYPSTHPPNKLINDYDLFFSQHITIAIQETLTTRPTGHTRDVATADPTAVIMS